MEEILFARYPISWARCHPCNWDLHLNKPCPLLCERIDYEGVCGDISGIDAPQELYPCLPLPETWILLQTMKDKVSS